MLFNFSVMVYMSVYIPVREYLRKRKAKQNQQSKYILDKERELALVNATD